MLFAISGAYAGDVNNTSLSSENYLQTSDDAGIIEHAGDGEIIGDADNGTFSALQKKIDEADTTVSLENDYKYEEGFTTEGIIINKNLTIDGNGHTIDGDKKTRLFTVTSSNVIFKNIIFINAHSEGDGGAINGFSQSINCTFKENYANGNGGAVFGGNAINCSFIGNCAEHSGGAISNGNATGCNFTDNNYAGENGGAINIGNAINCIFTGNSANKGGAIYKGDAENCIFTDNSASDDGGAIFQGSASYCNFENNKAGDHGGAMHHGDMDKCNAEYCNFTGNSAGAGGAIFIGNANYSTFTSNTAGNDHGGAIYNGDASYCTFTSNTAKHHGGAIYNGGASYCSFTSNGAWLGSAIYSESSNYTVTNCNFTGHSAYNGGAIYSENENFTVLNSYFTGNKARQGGAVYNALVRNSTFENNGAVESNDEDDGDGGAIYGGSAYNCTFTGNYADDDGDGGAMSHSHAENCIFTDNKADDNGGALYYTPAINCNFTNNYAEDDGGAMYIADAYNCIFTGNRVDDEDGGAIFNGNAVNCIFINNYADDDGGAMYHDDDCGDISAVNCTFIGNEAGDDGGAIYKGYCENCTFINNTGDEGGAMHKGSAVNCKFSGNYGRNDKEHSAIYETSTQNCLLPYIYLYKLFIDEDTINLNNDYYFEKKCDDDFVYGFILSHDITIEGNGHTIDGMKQARIFTTTFFTSVTLNNLVLINGHYESDFEWNYQIDDCYEIVCGGAIMLEYGCSLTTNNVDFINNSCNYLGGAIMLGYGVKNCYINGGKFIGNYVDRYGGFGEDDYPYPTCGGAIYCEALEGEFILNNVSFIDNYATWFGGAIEMGGSGEFKIIGGEFYNNTGYMSGAVDLSGGKQVTITGTKFINNTYLIVDDSDLVAGGGAINVNGPNTIIENAEFINNSAGYKGGAIIIYYGEVQITESKFINNSGIAGGAIYIYSRGNLIENCIFINNSANMGKSLEIIGNVHLTNNTINTDFAEIYVAGGYITSQMSVNVMENTYYDFFNPIKLYAHDLRDDNGNLIYDKGLYFLVGSNKVTAHYDAQKQIYYSDYTSFEEGIEYVVTVTSKHNIKLNSQSVIKVEEVEKGSFTDLAIQIFKAQLDSNSFDLPYDFTYNNESDSRYNREDLKNGLIINNSFYIDGHGHTINGSDLAGIFQFFKDVTLTNITFTHANSTDNPGGAVYIDNSEAVAIIHDCNFAYNTASDSGGAIYTNSKLTIYQCNFTSNFVESKGSAIYANNNLTLYDCIFINNKCPQNGTIFITSASYESSIKNSNFTCNENDGKYAIASASNLTLDKNNISYSILNLGKLFVHENNIEGTIYDYGEINPDTYYIDVIDGESINVTFKQTVHPYATLTNHDGNAIFDPDFRITMNGESIQTEYDDKNRRYTATYTFDFVCERIVSSNFKANYTISGKYTVISDVGSFYISAIESSEKFAHGKNITLNITIFDDSGEKLGVENLAIIFSAMRYFVNVTNGTGLLNLGVLKPGEYVAVGIYNSGPYDAYTSDIITVTSNNVYCDISVNGGNVLGEEGSISISLKNEEGLLITDDVELIFTDSAGNVINKSIITASNASVKLPFTEKLPAGSYNIVVKSYNYTFIQYSNDNGEAKLLESVEYIVHKKPTCLNVVGDTFISTSDGDKNIVFTLTDYNGTPLSGFNVTVSLNGVKNYMTDEDGRITVSCEGLNPGEYAANVIYGGNENYDSSDISSKVIVDILTSKLTANDVVATYNVNKNLIITLTDINGNPITNAEVSVIINGVKYYHTDKNGQIKVSVQKMVPDSYIAKISFKGNESYLESDTAVIIVVKKATPKIIAKSKIFKKSVKIKKYSIKLKNNNGAVMKKTKVYLKVKGKTYKAKTNSKGKATFKITKLIKKGKYTALIKYAGNKLYKAKSAKATIVVT